MDNFGGGFSRNTDNAGMKDYGDDKYDCLMIKQILSSSKTIVSDNDKFQVQGVEIGHPIFLARCVDVRTENTRIEHTWEDSTGQIKTMVSTNFDGHVPKIMEGISVE